MTPKHPGAYPFLKSKIPFAVLFLILVLILPRAPKFGYEYKRGSVWKYETLYSQFDFPILKTDEQIQAEKGRSTTVAVPYYKYADDVVTRNLKAAESLSFGRHAALKAPAIDIIREIYAQGIVSDEGVKLDKNASDASSQVLYIQKDKRAAKYPVSEVYRQSEAKSRLLSEMSKTYRTYNLDSIFKATQIYDLLVPNLIYDKQTTELVHAESSQVVSLTQGFVSAGQLIVSEGEIVTAEIAQMLDSYKAEYVASLGYSGPKALFVLGNILLALALVVILYLAIYFTNRTALRDNRKLYYILTVFLFATVGAIFVGNSSPAFLYMVPFTLSALWLQAFFKNKLILTVYVVTLLPLLIFNDAGVVLFTMFVVAGFVAIYAFKFFSRGWLQFITALITFAALALTYFAFRTTEAVSGNLVQALSFMFVGSILTVLGYPMVYLFEKIFGLVSNSRLMELADTGNPLLQEMEAKAPGTFQHSLQVMTMADVVARSIGADALLVRAGALYHDIGKISNPLCFVENESLSLPAGTPGYHSKLSAHESAKAIIAHVTDGMERAAKMRLPDVVTDFIITHHGTTCTKYFYNKYLNEGGDPENTADFYYPGRKPQTKEQIVVMLCDTIEAASRTLNSTSPEDFSNFVDNMVAAKMEAGQFDEADISLKEVNIVKDALKSYLVQLYHDRVAYPQRNA